jgi:hypothetical protein
MEERIIGSRILNETIGLLLVAVMLATFMFGIFSIQVYIYILRYPKDHIGLRLFVRGLWILDLVHSVLISVLAYHYMVTNFVNPLALLQLHWSLFAALITEALIVSLIQVFFAIRIYRINRKQKALYTITIFLSVVQMMVGSAGAIHTMIVCKRSEELFEFSPRLFAGTWCVTAVICDVVIMFGLVKTLAPRRTGYNRSDHIISVLIRWGIETGLATTMVALIDLILFVSVRNFAHLIFNFALIKLYTNTMIATLNARQRLYNEYSHSDSLTSNNNHSYGLSFGRPMRTESERRWKRTSNLTPPKPNVPVDGVEITVTTISQSDDVWKVEESGDLNQLPDVPEESDVPIV